MKNIYGFINEGVKKQGWAVLITNINKTLDKKVVTEIDEQSEDTSIVQKALEQGKPVVEERNEQILIAEPFFKRERMIFLGCGHITVFAADFAYKTGFEVIVVDDRPSFANEIRFPAPIKVICADFQSAIANLDITDKDFVLLATRGHKQDINCLKKLYMGTEPFYIGMVGSKSRVENLKQFLVSEGMEREWLDRIYSPVGLKIGAATPAEIAISIMSEVIARKRLADEHPKYISRSDADPDIIQKLADESCEMKMAVITIIETTGSTPRVAGAKMYVYENGITEGTIGGGCVEAGLAARARKLISNREYKVVNVDMTNDSAADEGMACGGTMKVLLENFEVVEGCYKNRL